MNPNKPVNTGLKPEQADNFAPETKIQDIFEEVYKETAEIAELPPKVETGRPETEAQKTGSRPPAIAALPAADEVKGQISQVTYKSPTLLAVENIMQADLEDAYRQLEPKLQQKFKAEGEKTAYLVGKLLDEAKVKANKIFKLIYQWLKIIPGINRFFLRQEAKIKTDKILKIKENQ
jgi:hypothetical protein